MAQIKSTCLLHLLSILIALAITTLSLSYLLFFDTTIITEYRDVKFSANLDNILTNYFSTWLNLEGIARSWFSIIIFFSSSVAIFVRLVFVFFYLAAFLLPYFSFYNIARKYFDQSTDKSFWIALCLAFFYSFNPFFIQSFSPPYTYVFSYALLPLVFLFSLNVLQQDKLRYLFYLAIALTFSITPIIRYAIPVFIVFGTIVLVASSMLNFNMKLGVLIKKMFFLLLFLFLLNSYWLLPTFISLGQKSITPTYEVTSNIVQTFSANYKLHDILGLNASWWPFLDVVPPKHVPTNIFNALYYLVPVLGIVPLFFYKKILKQYFGYYIMFFCITLTGVFLWGGTTNVNTIVGKLYKYILFGVPSSITWMLRMPGYFGTLVILGFAGLLSCFLLILAQIKKRYILPFVSALLIFIFILIGWQRLTGDLDGNLRKGYYVDREINNDISKERPLIILSSYFGEFRPNHLQGPSVTLPKALKNYIEFNALSYSSKFIDYTLSLFGTNSIISNLTFENDETSTLKKTENKLLVHSFHPDRKNSIIQLKYPSELFFSSEPTSALYDFLAKENPSALFTNSRAWEASTKIIDATSLMEQEIINHSQIVSPFKYVYEHNPLAGWSRARTSDPLHAEWHAYLDELRLDNWQNDYDVGLIFSNKINNFEQQEADSVSIPFNASKSGEYSINIRYFQNIKGGEIIIEIADKSFHVNTKNSTNKFVLETLGTVDISKGDNVFRVTNINGFNAMNFLALSLNASKTPHKENDLEDKDLFYLYEAESDFMIQNGILTNNINSSNNTLVACNNTTVLIKKINLLRTGEHRIFMKGEGVFQLFVDDQPVELFSTKDELFASDLLKMDSGEHVLRIGTKTTNNNCHVDYIEIDNSYRYVDYNHNLPLSMESAESDKNVLSEINKIKKVNPTLYEIGLNLEGPMVLVLSENYDPLWRLHLVDQAGNSRELEPLKINNLVNGFFLETSGENIKIQIYYKPQYYFYIGLFVSSFFLIIFVGYLSYDFYREQKKKLVVPTK